MEKNQLKCKKDYYYKGKLEYEVGKIYYLKVITLDGVTYINVVGDNLALTDYELKIHFDDIYQLRKHKIKKLLSGTI